MSTSQPLVLSLFPGVGLLDMAFEEQGFCIVRGPDVLWGGDIRQFHPPAGKFDGIIGGPPCQCFSSLVHLVRANGHQPRFGNLIPEFERCVNEAQPLWYLMENVRQAPLPNVAGYGRHSFLLENGQLGQAPRRLRRWSFGWRGGRRVLFVETVALFPAIRESAALGGNQGPNGQPNVSLRDRNGRKRGPNSCVGQNFKTRRAYSELCRKQGLPETFTLEPFTVVAACKAVGNGVPLAMGRALAKAVMEAISQ